MPIKSTYVKCTVDSCNNPNWSTGLCSKHYQQKRRYGEVKPDKSLSDELAWIMAHAEYDGGECLIWPFKRAQNGYGPCRRMCTAAHGDPPFKRAESLHSCGNGDGGCINPNHLRWGTRQDNVDDLVRHHVQDPSRSRRMKYHSNDMVIDIFEAEGRQIDIAVRFGVSQAYVSKIKSRKLRA